MRRDRALLLSPPRIKQNRLTKRALASLSDADLLRCRFCDLPVDLANTPVAGRVQRVFAELRGRGIKCRPTVWLSEEWFNPDGAVGFAVPFYLAHPRLIRLERDLMFEAEGASDRECMRILRHETGHAIDEAFQLHRRADYARIFGSPKQPYPTAYSVEPVSREYVINLNAWYAQAHPVEDFAETFAVWLGSKRWAARYGGWPALRKLQQVERWMARYAGQRPLRDRSAPVETLEHNERTLAQHYREKRAFYRVAYAGQYDGPLQRLFPPARSLRHRRRHPTASHFLRSLRVTARSKASDPLGVPAYVVDQILRHFARRARALDLRVTRDRDDLTQALIKVVTRATISVLRDGQRLPL
jgi:Putative zinc-binding metallo-peptidase